ncbi:MAG TPA: hypothetical protein DC063_06070 [Arenimonas sp.]|nr:hypothetical protein [Arenimonas sp.]
MSDPVIQVYPRDDRSGRADDFWIKAEHQGLATTSKHVFIAGAEAPRVAPGNLAGLVQWLLVHAATDERTPVGAGQERGPGDTTS